MWTGGVRAVILNDEGKLLLVRQKHSDSEFWLLPGGAVEEGENSEQAVIREVAEETGLTIVPVKLIWHIEEVSPKRGMRFVNFFYVKIVGGDAALGRDPEFAEDEQVLSELKYMSREEVSALTNIYPLSLKDEVWDIIDNIDSYSNSYRLR